MNAKFLRVESELSAMAAVIGSASCGVRSFTATSSHGLALMHELLHWTSGARLPIVMAEVNRALGPGWNIWADQTDSLSQRDTGWIQLYCEDVQEVFDTMLVAYKLAETVSLPVMVVMDAFFLSHTCEPVDLPSQSDVDGFLPPWRPVEILDTTDPKSFHSLSPLDYYMEFRYKIQRAMEDALAAYVEIDAEYGHRFGRSYGICEVVLAEEGARSSIALVTTGSVTGTARAALAELACHGKKVDLVKLKLFRPFPHEEIRKVLALYSRIAVVDRNLSFGSGGIFAQEIRSALGGLDRPPIVYPFVAGLGGRDITPETIASVVDRTQKEDNPADILWVDLRE
jgi:pyruvate/2-oxoacid:ferredoxin oxidoreductase alpha subunit